MVLLMFSEIGDLLSVNVSNWLLKRMANCGTSSSLSPLAVNCAGKERGLLSFEVFLPEKVKPFKLYVAT